MADFLLELLSEEIPARMQEKAQADLRRLFEAEIARGGLAAAAIETFATPRRLALIARGLPAQTAATSEELKGPRADAPEPAIAGFLGKTGLARDQLVERADAKGNRVLFAVRETPGRPAADVLGHAVPAIVRGFPWPKSMRWGAASSSTESTRWVRPLQGIVALLDEAVVPCAAAGVSSGRETTGHRFMASGAVSIARAADYVEALRAACVIVDPAERQAIVRDAAGAAARAAGLTLVEDEGLVVENAGLTEWPVPLLGRFDPAFLDVPREVIQLTMRTNQKYFACTDADGALAPAFVCTANIAASDGGAAIVAGNARVLAARLSDARFFWEGDLKVPLGERAEKLSGIVFHEKLGTVADKVERVAKLARWLVEEGIVRGEPISSGATTVRAERSRGTGPSTTLGANGAEGLADLAERAARLCKADLVTGMVGEFPELQGVIGGYLAAAQGEDAQVAAAIRDHYKPVGQNDEVPTAPVTVAVSLADKLDSLAAFFVADDQPTGSKDPFALRRAILAFIAIIERSKLRLNWMPFFAQASEAIYEPALNYRLSTLGEIAEGLSQFRWPDRPDQDDEYGITADVLVSFRYDAEAVHRRITATPVSLAQFLIDRLKVQQREAGVRHDLIDAVFALGGEDDLVRLLARVKALQAFLASEDGANLLTAYRRAANILRKEGHAPSPQRGEGARGDSGHAASDGGHPHPTLSLEGEGVSFSYDPEPAERALADALGAQLPAAATAVADERFEDAMAALAALRAPIDAFFDGVTVNDPDRERRTTRLALLGKLVAAMHNVADFSKIEG